jgi:predicted DNA-binding protein
MAATKRRIDSSVTARTIRFPKRVRDRLAADAERCGRSFESQVIAVLRRHYGEDVDIAPSADAIVALARGSLEGISAIEQRKLVRRLSEPGS